MKAPRVWYVGGEDVHMRIPLLRRLAARGFAIAAVGTGGRAAFAREGVEYHEYRLDRWINPLADLRAIDALAGLFQAGHPELVHAFDTKPGILAARAACRVEGLAFVRTITGMGYLFSSRSPLALMLRPLYRVLQRAAARGAAMTIFQNEDDRRYFLANGLVPPERSALVRGSGIDVRAFLDTVPAPAKAAELRCELGVTDRIVVTMVARLVRHKGVLEFLRCARGVRSRDRRVVFLLVGPHATEGRQAVAPQTLQEFADDVIYLGARNDVPAVLAISDLFVLPSYYREGVPRALLEAAALGLPLVTTDNPGCRDVVKHGWNGILVPPRDAAALERAIEAIVRELEAWRERGRRGRGHVEDNFEIDLVADAYAGIYRAVLEARVRTDQGRLEPN